VADVTPAVACSFLARRRSGRGLFASTLRSPHNRSFRLAKLMQRAPPHILIFSILLVHNSSGQYAARRVDVKRPSLAIIGAGMGGLAAAAALRGIGIDVAVYEQAQRFARVGAGIQIGCNAMKVLRAFGLEPVLRAGSFYPRSWNNKDYDTGAVRFDMIFGEVAESRYGAPYLLAHRGDLHAALASVVADSNLRLGHRLTSFEQRGDGSVSISLRQRCDRRSRRACCR
jgi:hypothetical protein